MTTIRATATERSLFHVAAAELSDATQWWRLAQLNGLTDPSLMPFLTPIPLKIPLADETLTNGIPSE